MSVTTNNNLKCTIALASLQMVMDPEIGLNVVDLGLIYQLDFDEANNKIYCGMTLTTLNPISGSITICSDARAMVHFRLLLVVTLMMKPVYEVTI